MKTIYLHIGFPKTGTTSIQQFLFTNRKELVNHGLLYPETGLGANKHQIYEKIYMKGLWRIITLEKPFQTNQEELINALKDEIDRSQCDKVCISSEGLI